VLAAALAAALVAALVAALGLPPAAFAQVAPRVPAEFAETTVWSGLERPTAVRFAPDGKVFVAEKSGIVKVFDSTADPTPTVFADLRTNVHNFWDRGLLSLAVDPGWPARPYVYVLYTYDALPGGTAPRWGVAGQTADSCPSPPGATTDGCVVTGRLTRLTAGPGGVWTGTEHVLLRDWCQQFPSHSVADLTFGPDGALYVSAGDGASFNYVDYGQAGGSPGSPTPRNACGDPPGAVGDLLTPPTAQGGALRSQDLRTPGDPTSLDGTVLRVHPDTGAAFPGNPLAGGAVADDDRIVAIGLRNPFRFGFRPGTSELWVGDVGWGQWEEINRIISPTATVTNFGWPCYEGAGRQSGYDSANLDLCEALYLTPGAVTPPYYAYDHAEKVDPADSCPTGTSSVTGVAFEAGGGWPAPFAGALFFADYARGCIWAMPPGAGGLPDVAARRVFGTGTAAVDLRFGPDGHLYYADLLGNAVRRIEYRPANRPPIAAFDADPTSGPAPLLVTFDGAFSSDPDPGDTLAWTWDLDGDGARDDATGPTPTWTYTAPGAYLVTLRVTDGEGAYDEAQATITAGDAPPTATIEAPPFGHTWRVDDPILFAGGATDGVDGVLPPAALRWDLVLHHCAPDDPHACHVHDVQSFVGVAAGAFVAPEHEYPSFLELRLTASDSAGLTGTDAVDLYPETAVLRLVSAPPGLTLSLNAAAAPAPFERQAIVGARVSLGAPSPQQLAGSPYRFFAWSDGGPASHDAVVGAADATYRAQFEPECSAPATCPLACPADDVREPNDARLAAAPVVPGVTTYGIVCPNDADWFTFPAAAGCGIRVDVGFVHAAGNLNVQLFGPTGTQLGAAYSTTDDEVVLATAAAGGAHTVHVYGFQGATNRYGLRVTLTCAAPVETACADGVDEDGDGLTDCADPDCAAAPVCATPPEQCDNGLDDDGDGHTDCADADCAGAAVCLPHETDCANGLDDDGDGLTDCADADCAGTAGCAPTCPADDAFEPNDTSAAAYVLAGSGSLGAIVCAHDDDWYAVPAAAGCTVTLDLHFTNALGNLNLRLIGANGAQLGGAYGSGDGERISAVATTTGLQRVHVYGFQGASNVYVLDVLVTCPGAVEADCANALDDDGDGLVDCADPDCVAGPVCVVPPEQCTNGVDDDGDGLTDCADPDCGTAPTCAPVESNCTDGVDNDGDGQTDCADLDCAGTAGCAPACPADDVFEPNDFEAAAAPILAGALLDAVVCAHDADWYAFEAQAGCRIDVDLTFTNALGNLNLQLRRPGGVQLAAAYSQTDDEHVSAVTPVSGTHTLHVYGFQGAQNGYGLLVTVTCP
jgi:glucose/arabinose dehydrogenase